ncbi:MAG: hypothetical protein P8J02_13730 [Yoonia sp.]|nr:hypothetical protein [Yoonia sp.]
MVIFVFSFVGVIWLAGFVLGVVAGMKAKPVLALLVVVLLAIISWAAVYKLGVNLGQIAHMGSDTTAFRTTASDVGGAKAMAQVTMLGAVAFYAVGWVAGMIRKKKRNADA